MLYKLNLVFDFRKFAVWSIAIQKNTSREYKCTNGMRSGWVHARVDVMTKHLAKCPNQSPATWLQVIHELSKPPPPPAQVTIIQPVAGPSGGAPIQIAAPQASGPPATMMHN